jgi:hypothetical protein
MTYGEAMRLREIRIERKTKEGESLENLVSELN